MESRAEAVSSGGLSSATPMFLRVKTLILLALLCSVFNTGVRGTFFFIMSYAGLCQYCRTINLLQVCIFTAKPTSLTLLILLVLIYLFILVKPEI